MCKCGCGQPPTLGYKGYKFGCAPQEIKDKVGTKKQVAAKNRNGRNKVRVFIAQKENEDRFQKMAQNAQLVRWFEEIRKTMTGKCQHCGGKTQRDDDKTFHYSIAHILPKNHFKSVATHPDNYLELCFYGSSCHTNLDTAMIDLIDLNCFDQVIQKFTRIYPSIAMEERRRIPPILIEYLNTEK